MRLSRPPGAHPVGSHVLAYESFKLLGKSAYLHVSAFLCNVSYTLCPMAKSSLRAVNIRRSDSFLLPNVAKSNGLLQLLRVDCLFPIDVVGTHIKYTCSPIDVLFYLYS